MDGSRFYFKILAAAALQLLSAPFGNAAKADTAGNSDSFASSLWGAFLFAILGLAAFVALLIFLIRFVCERSPPPMNVEKAPKPKKEKKAKTLSAENLVNNQAPPAIANFDNHATSFDTSPSPYSFDNSALASSSYPQFNQPGSAFRNQALYSPPSTVPYVTSAYAPPSQDSMYEPSNVSPKMLANFPVPAAYEHAGKKSEDSASSDEEPFTYLEKYQPYTAIDSGAMEQAHLDELPTKRAVLRDSTPYQVIEERVQGEDYDDQVAFVPGNTLNPSPPLTTGNNLSSGSFNDGKIRMVRVLPRFHHESPPPQSFPTSPPPPAPVFSSVGPAFPQQQQMYNPPERFF